MKGNMTKSEPTASGFRAEEDSSQVPNIEKETKQIIWNVEPTHLLTIGHSHSIIYITSIEQMDHLLGTFNSSN